MTARVDMLVGWNFRHMVNLPPIGKYNEVDRTALHPCDPHSMSHASIQVTNQTGAKRR